MTKPTNPNITLPESFATEGRKTDFSDEKILNGFDPINPDVLCGDNLNKFIDDTYKGLNYSMDCIHDLYKGAVLYDSNETYNLNSLVFHVDSNNKTHLYRSLSNNNSSNSLTNSNYWQEIIIDSSNFVSKSGDTMSGALQVNGLIKGTSGLDLISNALSKGTNPASASYWGIRMTDGDSSHTTWQSNRFGIIESSVMTDGSTKIQIATYKNEANSTNTASMNLMMSASGVASCTFPNTTCCDGQWVDSFHTLSTSTAQGNYEIDVSSFLPSDRTNYDYEIMVHFAGFRSSGDTNTYICISKSLLNITTEENWKNASVYGSANFDGNHGEAQSISCIVIARKNDDKFYLNITRANLTNSALVMTKYRRIGTNA